VQGYLPLEVVVPAYPDTALVQGIEGRLVVEFTIGSDGSIQEPKIISRSATTKVFDKAVLAAIKKSRYQPQMFDGQPVILHGVKEEFIFKLEPSSLRRR
jgi:TonB family protein